MAKRKSTRLDEFTRQQLRELAADYATIRREANKLARMGLARIIRLPMARSQSERLAVLRKLETKEHLWIRISYAGNLNVCVREAPDVGDGKAYMTVLRRPATEWCIPRGSYTP